MPRSCHGSNSRAPRYGIDQNADEKYRIPQAAKLTLTDIMREFVECFENPYRLLRLWIIATSKSCRVYLSKTSLEFQANEQLNVLP